MTSRDISEEILEVENCEDDDSDEDFIATKSKDKDMPLNSPDKSSSPTNMSYNSRQVSSSFTDMSPKSFDNTSNKKSSSTSKSSEFFELHGGIFYFTLFIFMFLNKLSIVQ